MEQIASPFSINKYALSHDRFFDNNNKVIKKISGPNWEELYKLQQRENEQYKVVLKDYATRFQDFSHGNSNEGTSESQVKSLMEMMNIKDKKYQ